MQLSFGEKIRNLIEDKDMKQTQLGKAVGMTQRKISYNECGIYEPSIDDIKAFASFLSSPQTTCWIFRNLKNRNNEPTRRWLFMLL